MKKQLAYLEVRGPDGQEFKVDLGRDRVTIGRFHDFNDVALEPDPQQLVTRKVHCAIEQDAQGWWVVDNGSVNRTFVHQGQEMQAVDGRALIEDDDVICILGKLTEAGLPIYWTVPYDSQIAITAVNAGRTFDEVDPSSEATYSLMALAQHTAGVNVERQKRRKFSLFSRK